MSIIKLDSKRWRVQIKRKGLLTFDRVVYSKSEAEILHADYIAELNSNIKQSADITLQGAWDGYSASLDFSKKAENSRKTEACRIKPVLNELGRYSLSRLENAPHLIYDYIDRRSKFVSTKTKRKISTTTIRLEIASISAVVAWAKKRRIVNSNFIRRIDRPGQAKRERRVPLKEQGKLRSAVMHFDFPQRAECARFLTLLRLLGCRPGELAKLKRIDVNFDAQETKFQKTKHQSQPRLVHATQESLGLLEAQFSFANEIAPNSPFLFSTKKRTKTGVEPTWGPYNYAWQVHKLKADGIVDSDFHPHAMRREYISRAIEHGLPYATISKQTGHSSTQAIEIYDVALSTAPDIRKALDAFEKSTSNEWLVPYLESLGLSGSALDNLKAELSGNKQQSTRRIFGGQK